MSCLIRNACFPFAYAMITVELHLSHFNAETKCTSNENRGGQLPGWIMLFNFFMCIVNIRQTRTEYKDRNKQVSEGGCPTPLNPLVTCIVKNHSYRTHTGNREFFCNVYFAISLHLSSIQIRSKGADGPPKKNHVAAGQEHPLPRSRSEHASGEQIRAWTQTVHRDLSLRSCGVILGKK